MERTLASKVWAVTTIDPQLLDILACPNCRGELRLDEEAAELVCTGCGYAYPIRDGVPTLLIDEARKPADG